MEAAKLDITNDQQAARQILSVAMWLHTNLADKRWLWRGQADASLGLEPGMHTRVLNTPAGIIRHDESSVIKATEKLLLDAKKLGLQLKDQYSLPDLALLAYLQHHGAATPLLDVTTDPLVALWMVAFANREDPSAMDDRTGALFAILRPEKEFWIDPLDSRPYKEISKHLNGHVWWYHAPDVTDRLKIQRGSFLLGELSNTSPRNETTLPLRPGDSDRFKKLINNIGKQGNSLKNEYGQLYKILITRPMKRALRELLLDRSGLSIDAIYPTPWNQPFLETFSKGYGRKRDLTLDI